MGPNDIVSHPLPNFPNSAFGFHEEPRVLSRLEIDHGRLVNVAAISGPPVFANATVKWIKSSWKFKATMNGTYEMPVVFSRKK
jgi:hypothetical protein